MGIGYVAAVTFRASRLALSPCCREVSNLNPPSYQIRGLAIPFRHPSLLPHYSKCSIRESLEEPNPQFLAFPKPSSKIATYICNSLAQSERRVPESNEQLAHIFASSWLSGISLLENILICGQSRGNLRAENAAERWSCCRLLSDHPNSL